MTPMTTVEQLVGVLQVHTAKQVGPGRPAHVFQTLLAVTMLINHGTAAAIVTPDHGVVV
ncbi:hypothetical protein KA082_03295 [Candidatus Woesebacteria bacterium]|nr:hypothetical protein [Candidatus Woesebacteria bacterium]